MSVITRFSPRIEKLCETCGISFSVLKNDFRRRFCSRKCSGLSRRIRIERKCPLCDTAFLTYERHPKKYCSRKCQIAAIALAAPERHREKVVKVCEFCKTEFTRHFGAMKSRNRYCSKACKYKSGMVSRITKICDGCGKEFSFRSTESRKSCSIECAHKLRIGINPSFYKELIKFSFHGPRAGSWKVQRKRAFDRDRGICQHCGISSDRVGKWVMQVHHVIPFRVFGKGGHVQANDLSNLITLCRRCHIKAEKLLSESSSDKST